MKIKFILFLLILSCTEPNLSIPNEIFYYLLDDKKPPKIDWKSPRFDEVVFDSSLVEFTALDQVGIASVELYVDSMKVASIDSNTDITNFEFQLYWDTTPYIDNSEHILYIYVIDNAGNDTVSNTLRVIIDNSSLYPKSVNLIKLDSIIIDSSFYGYQLGWEKANEKYFNKYILERSIYSSMLNGEKIFTTGNIDDIEYLDNSEQSNENLYYRVVVEDIFERRNPGDTKSNSKNNIPPVWNIETILYTKDSVTINWNKITFNDYKSHKILVSDDRMQQYDTLISLIDSSINQYTVYYEYQSENWFSILTQDSIGQISISAPKMHSIPSSPEIETVVYGNDSFEITWKKEPDTDFNYYGVMFIKSDNPYDIIEEDQITSVNTTNFKLDGILANEYFLFQIISHDVWGLKNRGPIISLSSFDKFSKKYNFNSKDIYYSIIVNNITGGYSIAGTRDGKDGIMLEVDQMGVGDSPVILNDNYTTGFTSIINDKQNEGYLLAGYEQTTEQTNDCKVVRIGISGAVEWSKRFGNTFHSGINAIENLSNGIGLTGYAQKDPGNQDLYIIKMDHFGNIEWQKIFGSKEKDTGNAILPADHGGMYILGETNFSDALDSEIWILEISSDGNVLDSVIIGGVGLHIGYSFARSPDGSFAIAGITNGKRSGVTDAYIAKVNQDLELEWSFQNGGDNPDIAYGITYANNGWVVAGQTFSFNLNGQEDGWLFKLSDSGELEWTNIIGDLYKDTIHDIKNTEDGGFILCGSTAELPGQDIGWIIKTDSRGNYLSFINYVP